MLYRENGQFKTSYRADQQIFPILQDRIFIAALLVLAAVAVPLLATEYLLRAILIPFLILSLAALGLNILVGYCGQISLGTGAFMAVGAYAAYNFAVRVPGMPLVRRAPARRRLRDARRRAVRHPEPAHRGLYLSVATLAAQFFVDWAFLRIKWFTNDSASGSVSVAGLKVFGFAIETPGAEVPVLPRLPRRVRGAREEPGARPHRPRMDGDPRHGRRRRGDRHPPRLRQAHGVRRARFIVGVAGALWGFVYLGSWEPAAFDIDRSFQLLFMVIIGGLGSIMGSFFGAAFIVVLPIVLDNLPVWFDLPIDTALASHLDLHDLRRADRVLPDRRAARAGAPVVDRQGKAAAVAVPALNSRRHPISTRTEHRCMHSPRWRQP